MMMRIRDFFEPTTYWRFWDRMDLDEDIFLRPNEQGQGAKYYGILASTYFGDGSSDQEQEC